MARLVLNPLFIALGVASAVNAYFLVGTENFITTERIDSIVNPGAISGHVHSVIGGSNFRFTSTTASLRASECTSMPIVEDKSNYWFPHLYFQWKNGSFTSVNGGSVIYYLYSDEPGKTTAFPEDFRMLSGNPTYRTYDANNKEQSAITYLCLDFKGKSTTTNDLPSHACPNGIRSQVNFPSCWDGKNVDSPDHKSHVAYLSEGADKGSCKDPKFPKTLPRIFLEVYWDTPAFDKVRSQAMTPDQPFVFSYGDRTGLGNHADFFNGWDKGVLEKVVDQCHCDPFGGAQCCADKGLFTLKKGKNCRITKSIDEQTTGTLPKLPGNNPVQEGRVVPQVDTSTPNIFSPVYAYTGDAAPANGPVVSADRRAQVMKTPASGPVPPPANNQPPANNGGNGGSSTSPSGTAPSSPSSTPATPANPPANQPASPPANQPANPPANQPATPPANQPANPPPASGSPANPPPANNGDGKGSNPPPAGNPAPPSNSPGSGTSPSPPSSVPSAPANDVKPPVDDDKNAAPVCGADKKKKKHRKYKSKSKSSYKSSYKHHKRAMLLNRAHSHDMI